MGKAVKFWDLIEKAKNFPKFPGTKYKAPGPMIHGGFPSAFNMSFAWNEWINEENQEVQYIDFTGNNTFSKYQPCIRHQDLESIISNKPNKYRYLSYFHMADVSGFIAEEGIKNKEKAEKFAIKSLLDFYKEIGLDLKKVHPVYLSGGTVKELTEGKYNFDFEVPQDPYYQYWIDNGILKENMIPDKSRDTFLALRNYYRPSPWGYRNEVLYEHNGKLLDISTIEFLRWEPVFDEEMKIINLKPYNHIVTASAIGVERILMALNGFKDIREIDLVKPLYDLMKKEYPKMKEYKADSLIQSLRAVQSIVADGGRWKNLNSRRREIVRMMYFQIIDTISEEEITFSSIKKLLSLNAELLKNEKMKESQDDVLEEIKERIESNAKNKHLPAEKRFQSRDILKKLQEEYDY